MLSKRLEEVTNKVLDDTESFVSEVYNGEDISPLVIAITVFGWAFIRLFAIYIQISILKN